MRQDLCFFAEICKKRSEMSFSEKNLRKFSIFCPIPDVLFVILTEVIRYSFIAGVPLLHTLLRSSGVCHVSII